MTVRPTFIPALSIALMATGWCSALSRPPQRSHERLKPDPELQAAIQRTLNPKSEEDLKKQLQHLRDVGGPNLETLIPQLLYYTIHGKGPAGEHDVKEAMALGIIGRQLNISPGSLFTELVRLLGTDDPDLRKEVRNLLSSFDFSYFTSRVSGDVRGGREVHLPLVAYMYERDPGKSMLALGSAFLMSVTPLPPARRAKWRSLLWADHVVADTVWKHEHDFLDKTRVEPEAAVQLDNLSKDDAWWVRLYVAEIMRQHPAFRRPELIARLKDDPHPLVREAIAAMNAKPKRRAAVPPKKAAVPPPPPGIGEKKWGKKTGQGDRNGDAPSFAKLRG